jgi:hypothetical protein
MLHGWALTTRQKSLSKAKPTIRIAEDIYHIPLYTHHPFGLGYNVLGRNSKHMITQEHRIALIPCDCFKDSMADSCYTATGVCIWIFQALND